MGAECVRADGVRRSRRDFEVSVDFAITWQGKSRRRKERPTMPRLGVAPSNMSSLQYVQHEERMDRRVWVRCVALRMSTPA